MIEKIKSPLDLKVGNYKGTEFDIIPADTFAMVCRKINELVNAVNGVEKDREEIKEWIGIVSDLRSRVPVVESRVSILEEYAHPTAKTPADPYAEQRNWLGCLCRFWFDNKRQADIGILGDIDEDEIYPYFNADLGHNYKCCEPVKPDDDIIYKGEQDER